MCALVSEGKFRDWVLAFYLVEGESILFLSLSCAVQAAWSVSIWLVLLCLSGV